MLGLTLREEFPGKRLKGTAIELANDSNTGATQIAAQQFLEITYPTHGSEILMNCASTLWITIWCCTRRLANTFICCRSSIIGSFRLTLRRIGALIR